MGNGWITKCNPGHSWSYVQLSQPHLHVLSQARTYSTPTWSADPCTNSCSDSCRGIEEWEGSNTTFPQHGHHPPSMLWIWLWLGRLYLQIYTYNNPRNKTKDPPTAPKNNFCPWTGGGRDTTPKPTIDIQHFKKPNLSDHTSQTIFAPQMRTDFWTTRIVMSFLGGIPKKKTQPPLPGEVGGCHRYFFRILGSKLRCFLLGDDKFPS